MGFQFQPLKSWRAMNETQTQVSAKQLHHHQSSNYVQRTTEQPNNTTTQQHFQRSLAVQLPVNQPNLLVGTPNSQENAKN